MKRKQVKSIPSIKNNINRFPGDIYWEDDIITNTYPDRIFDLVCVMDVLEHLNLFGLTEYGYIVVDRNERLSISDSGSGVFHQ
jgi:hypothetical protein